MISVPATLVIPSTEARNLAQDVASLEAGGHLDSSSALMRLEDRLSLLALFLQVRLFDFPPPVFTDEFLDEVVSWYYYPKRNSQPVTLGVRFGLSPEFRRHWR